MINILKFTIFLLFLSGSIVQAQTNSANSSNSTNSSNSSMSTQAPVIALYLSITDSSIITQVLPSGKPIFNNSSINSIVDQYNVTDFHKAFPKSRYLHLKQVYRLNCTDTILGSSLKSNFPQLFPYYEKILDYHPTADYYPNDWYSGPNMEYLNYIGAPTAWGITKGDSNFVIGVTDTYFDMTNPDLHHQVELLSGNVTPYYNPNTGYYDTAIWNHGTLVAGLVAGRTDNGYAYPSMGFKCKLDLATDGTEGMHRMSDNSSNNGRKVLNASWGSTMTFPQTLDNFIQVDAYNEIYENGTFAVFGAGNSDTSYNGPNKYLLPASLNHNFSVTNVGWENPYGGSSTFNVEDVHEIYIGDTTVNCYHHNDRVDICAPAIRIGGLTADPTQPNKHFMYDEGWGTSFAAPLVAGTAGLIRSYNTCLTPYQVEYILKKTAKNIYLKPENQKYKGTTQFNGRLGAGKLEAGLALIMTDSFSCNNNLANTFIIKGIEINSICKPGSASNGVKPKLIPVLKNGKAPYKYHWYPLPGNQSTLDDYDIEQPTIITSTGSDIAYYRLTVYDNSEIQKVADKIIRIKLTSAPAFDLAMRDHYMDMMDEPNSMTDLDPRIWDVWTSPDIWNRQIQDGINTHENPEYFTSNPNYAYVKVRNVGCANSPSTARLRIYWSKASTGEQWRDDWNGTTKVGGSNGGVVDAGGEITSNGGIAIPALAPGEFTILNHEWFPINPHDYSGSPENVDVCFLGRIESATTYPYGMTIPETYNESVTKNIKNNNNVVSRNMILTDFLPGNNMIIHWVDFANASAFDGSFAMELINDRSINPHHAGNLSAVAEVTLYLGDLYYIWKDAGGKGAYLSFDDENQSVSFDGSTKLELTGIPLAARARFPIKLMFILKDGVELNDNEFLLHFRQFDESDLKDVYGAVNFLITTHADVQKQSIALQSKLKTDLPNQFTLYPNPANDEINLSWKELKVSAQIEVVDVYGRVLISLNNQRLDIAPLQINVSTLVPGIYFVNVRAVNGLNEQQKFIRK